MDTLVKTYLQRNLKTNHVQFFVLITEKLLSLTLKERNCTKLHQVKFHYTFTHKLESFTKRKFLTRISITHLASQFRINKPSYS